MITNFNVSKWWLDMFPLLSLNQHPGGYDVILEHAGRDATFAFRGSGHSSEAVQMLKKFEIGLLPMGERLYRHSTPIFRWGELPE